MSKRWNFRSRKLLTNAVSALGLGLGLALNQAQAAAPDGAVAIRNVRIFDGVSVAERGTVLVKNGLIYSIKRSGNSRVARGFRVIDGAGQTLIPGLIDAHVHFVDGYRANGGTALEEAAAYGITTVMDLATGNPTDYIEMRKAVKAGAYPDGADLFTAGPGAETRQLREPGEAQAWVDQHKAGGADYIKIFAYHPDERGSDQALKPETMAAIIAAAHKDGLMAVSHSLTESVSRQLVAAGLDGLVHITPSTRNQDDFGRLLASHHTFQSSNIVGVAPAAYRLQLAGAPELAAYMPAFMVSGLEQSREPKAGAFENEVANFKLIHDAGVLMAAGTDGFFPYSPLLHVELQILVQDGGVSPVEALRMATTNAALAYHLADRGRIAVGRRADLVLVDGDPTRDILATRRIAAVWIKGHLVDRAGLRKKLANIPAPPPRATQGAR